MDEREKRLERIEGLLRAFLLDDLFYLDHPRYEKWIRDIFRGERPWPIGMEFELLEEAIYRRRRAHTELRDMQQRVGRLSEELHRILLPTSLGLDGALFPSPRYISISIYSSSEEGEATSRLEKAVRAFFDGIGFEFADDFPPIRGSWWKRWFAKTKQALTQQEVAERLAKAERALELAQLQQRQAEVDKNQSTGMAELIQALEKTDNAVLQAGSILLLKQSHPERGCNIISRTLSPLEMIFLERNASLLKSPDDILPALAKVNSRTIDGYDKL